MNPVIDAIMLVLFVLFMLFIFVGYHKGKMAQREEQERLEQERLEDKKESQTNSKK